MIHKTSENMIFDSKLLKNIYRSPEMMSEHLHDTASCKAFCTYFAQFGEAVVKKRHGWSGNWQITEDESRALHYAVDVLNGTKENVLWFPEYGCIVIQFMNDCDHFANMNTLVVLGLDSHRYELHETFNHTSEAMDFVNLFVGTGLKEDIEEVVLPKFQRLYEKASNRCGDDRSTANGRQGHQKTPVFIQSLLLRAIECFCESEETCQCSDKVPKGGFTDCGLHTGESSKNSFSL